MRSALAFALRSAVVLPAFGIAAACAVAGPSPGSPPAPSASPRGGAAGPGNAASAAASSGSPAPGGSAPLPMAAPDHLFDPPPMGPLPPPPPLPPRPADKVPSAAEQATKIADCARHKTCQDCVEAHKCGYCPDTDSCTPGDLFGPYPGTCSGAWVSMQCTLGPIEAARYDAATRANLAKEVKGFTPDGPPVDHPISQPRSPVVFNVHRGRCYQVSLRLSADIDERFDLKPTAVPHVVYYEGGQAKALHFDAFVIDSMCPQQDGTVDVYIGTERGKKGAWRAQLWSTPIEDAELVRQRDVHETAKRRAGIAAWCQSCITEWARCRVAGEPRCAISYYQCLAAAKLTPADCERGDVAPPPPEPDGPTNEARSGPPSAL